MAAINFLARLVRPHDTRQFNARHRMKRIHRGSPVLSRRQGTDTSSSDAGAPAPSTSNGTPSSSSAPAAPTPPPGVVVPQPPPVLPTTSDKVVGTQAPAEAPAKTNPGSGKCTPSPTKSLAPSASKCIPYNAMRATSFHSYSLDHLPVRCQRWQSQPRHGQVSWT